MQQMMIQQAVATMEAQKKDKPGESAEDKNLQGMIDPSMNQFGQQAIQGMGVV